MKIIDLMTSLAAEGQAFLQQLAAASGGQHLTADCAQELADKTERLLLTA